jgi:hypothetical protein
MGTCHSATNWRSWSSTFSREVITDPLSKFVYVCIFVYMSVFVCLFVCLFDWLICVCILSRVSFPRQGCDGQGRLESRLQPLGTHADTASKAWGFACLFVCLFVCLLVCLFACLFVLYPLTLRSEDLLLFNALCLLKLNKFGMQSSLSFSTRNIMLIE